MADITVPTFTAIDAPDSTSPKVESAQRTKKVLVVEDLAEMRFMLKSMMGSLGFTHIDVEPSGQQALKRILEGKYDIVLSDLNLGGSIDGQQILEVTRKTYALDHSTIFIMITADTMYESVVGVLEYQPDGYLVKPFPPEAFVRRLTRVITQKKAFTKINNARLKGDYESVEREARELMKANPAYISLCSKAIGESLFARGKYKEAKTHYMLITQKNKNLAWAWFGIAQCEQKLGALAAAAKNLEQTIALSRHFLSAYDLLADVYVAMKEPAKAQDVLKKVVEISPRVLERSQRLGRLSQELKDWETAESAFSRVVRLARDSSFDGPEIYYDHLKSVTDLIRHTEPSNKLLDKFKKSLFRLRQFGKENPSALSNSYRLEIQQMLARNRRVEATRAWESWHRLIREGKATPLSDAQEMTLKKMLGLTPA